ncbi:hypothetical protein BJ508DRAFT_375868 [Ascobolus immersus RN42]|uniref:Uncharacterized protein n=1 Tax=Ascobolus immersus RN42 TaxID=1160509 RepID=A0A3N4ID53_ASCIM|nr:hypothetical protein BJ508DRAFT_375868 [Ascobolus immersus RN42]
MVVEDVAALALVDGSKPPGKHGLAASGPISLVLAGVVLLNAPPVAVVPVDAAPPDVAGPKSRFVAVVAHSESREPGCCLDVTAAWFRETKDEGWFERETGVTRARNNGAGPPIKGITYAQAASLKRWHCVSEWRPLYYEWGSRPDENKERLFVSCSPRKPPISNTYTFSRPLLLEVIPDGFWKGWLGYVEPEGGDPDTDGYSPVRNTLYDDWPTSDEEDLRVHRDKNGEVTFKKDHCMRCRSEDALDFESEYWPDWSQPKSFALRNRANNSSQKVIVERGMEEVEDMGYDAGLDDSDSDWDELEDIEEENEEWIGQGVSPEGIDSLNSLPLCANELGHNEETMKNTCFGRNSVHQQQQRDLEQRFGPCQALRLIRFEIAPDELHEWPIVGSGKGQDINNSALGHTL